MVLLFHYRELDYNRQLYLPHIVLLLFHSCYVQFQHFLELTKKKSEQVKLIEKLIQRQFISNPDVSARQIPVWYRFRDSIPLTANSKVDYNSLAKEPLVGNEICVSIEETNISIDKITVN